MTSQDDQNESRRPPSRTWRSGERSKVSIMQIFRSSFQAHDARRGNQRVDGADIEITQRSRQRRAGMSETELRSHLETDLGALLNTIRLDAVVDLKDAPHVATSILNYGFCDLSGIGAADLKTGAVVASIRQSLMDHEPRIVPASLDVRVLEAEASVNQRLSITVSAELMGDPVDIPLNFDAEVDLGAGKMKMSKLRVQM
jgi:type VI secretion system protein ImpF